MSTPIMTAATTALYLQKLLLANPIVPILLLWDRATWHRGPAIRTLLAANPRLEILAFPPGSPELNPQEHVWKKARENVSHNHSITHLAALVAKFTTYLQQTTFPSTLLDNFGYNAICPMFI